MKTHDSLGRRLRHADVPEDKLFRYEKHDVEWYWLLHCHGPLPTSFLYEFTKDVRSSKVNAQHRLTGLTKNLKTLSRLKNKVRSENPWADECVYTLNDESISILEANDRWSEWTPKLQPPYEHMLMCSSLPASLHIQAKFTDGYEFIPQQGMIQRPLEFPVPYEGHDKKLIPDALTGLKTSAGTLAMFWEMDRSTEPNTSSKYRSSLERKVDMYSYLFKEGLYKADDEMLFFVTTTEAKRKAFLDIIEKKYKKGYRRIATHVIPSFGTEYKIPRPVDILSIAWKRAGYPDFRLG